MEALVDVDRCRIRFIRVSVSVRVRVRLGLGTGFGLASGFTVVVVRAVGPGGQVHAIERRHHHSVGDGGRGGPWRGVKTLPHHLHHIGSTSV